MKVGVILEGFIGALAVAGTIIMAPLLRPRYRCWGATDDEANMAIPGDEFVSDPKSELTMAVTVQAPAPLVWPWLLQLGCQRAGWYSYDLLDNGGVASAQTIVPEFQHLELGDTIKATPKGDFGFPVAIIETNQQLTMAGTLNTETGEEIDPKQIGSQKYFSGNQTFLLKEIDEDSTRLIFRMRIDWNPSLSGTIINRGIVEPLSFVMARKTLLNLGRRAQNLTTESSGLVFNR